MNMRRTILSVLALVLTLGLAAQASAAETDRLAGTKWTHTDPNNSNRIGFEFTEKGTFTFTITGSPEVKGLYSIVGDNLRLKVFGRDANNKLTIDVIEVKLVSLSDDRMVTRLDNREREFFRVR
jgi:uncharacterized protein (TIGR03066 family)